MLDEKTLSALPEAIYTRLSRLNRAYLEQIGRKIKEIGSLSPGDLHKLQRMQTYGDDVETELEQISAKNADEIRSIIETVAKDTYEAALPAMTARGIAHIPYEENTALKRYVESITRQTVGEYINITQHTAFCIFGADGSTKSFFKENSRKVPTSLSDTYTRVIDEAVTAAQMGEIDYQSAMRQTMRALSDCGIRTVDYATGYSRRLDTAVRQNVLWGIKQCATGTAEQVGEDFGADGWEISYHANPRPSHVAMGGRQYAAGSTGRTVGGKYYPPFSGALNAPETLLQDFNCLHRKFPIMLGVSEPAYDEDELAALKERDRQTFEYEGKQYTGYEATQVQRKLETEMRRQKDRANLFAVSGDDDGRRAAQEKLNILTRKYKEFSDAAGLDTHKERMSVSGFHRVKTQTELKRNQISTNSVLTFAEKGGILKSSDDGFFGSPVSKGIGAKSANYPAVYYPGTDIPVKFVAGSRPFFPADHTMAGFGCKTGRQIDDIERLTEEYNCDARRWRKEKAQYEVYDRDGNIRVIELHWYQHPEIGKVEFKVKAKGGFFYIDDWE